MRSHAIQNRAPAIESTPCQKPDMDGGGEESVLAKVGRRCFFALWLFAVMGGTLMMMRYSEASGASAQAPPQWPQESMVPGPAGQPVLLMFVHPKCPCSRASLGELERLLAQAPGRFDTCLLFLRPPGTGVEWAQDGLWQKAALIPGITLKVDDDGREADLFHAATSGQTLLYDGSGKLLFEGGITTARGHAGDSAGQQAVLTLLERKLAGVIETPVFGCSLCEPGGAE